MNNQLTVAQILGALFRHRYKALLVWSIVMGLVIAAFLLWPRKYGSEGRLYVQLGRIATGISPAGGSASVSVQDTRETEIRSVVEIINSRAVIGAVVDDLGADRILAGPLSKWFPSFGFLATGSSGGDQEQAVDEYNRLKRREQAAVKIENNLTIHAQKKTSVISVFARASSSDLAREIVERMFDHTQRIHLKVHAVDGSTRFFDEHFVKQEDKLVGAVQKLSDFRDKNKVLSVGGARETLQQILSRLDNEVLDAEVQTAQVAERVASLKTGMATTEKQMAVPTSNMESKAFEDSKHMVFQLETERERLVSTYSAIHPEVKRIDDQLIKVKRSLKAMSQGRTESAMTSNPVYEDLKVELVRAQAEHAGWLARLTSLREKQTANEEELKKMNAADVTSDQLRRDVDIARQYLSIYAQKRGEAKAISFMDKQGISDIVVSQPPTVNVKHVSPRGSLILPLGAMLGLVSAFGAALFFERNHLSPLLNEGEVEQILELPVLVTLPRVYSSRNMVN